MCVVLFAIVEFYFLRRDDYISRSGFSNGFRSSLDCTWSEFSNFTSESGKFSGSCWETSGVGVDCSGVGNAAISVAKASKAWQRITIFIFPVVCFAPQELDIASKFWTAVAMPLRVFYTHA